jgi:hypothetical protein
MPSKNQDMDIPAPLFTRELDKKPSIETLEMQEDPVPPTLPGQAPNPDPDPFSSGVVPPAPEGREATESYKEKDVH